MRSSCHCALKSSIPTKSCSKNQKAAYVHKFTISLRGNENLHGGSVVVGIDDGDARMELAQPLQLPDQKLVVVACELVQPPDATCLCLILFFVIAPEDEQVVGDAPNRQISWNHQSLGSEPNQLLETQQCARIWVAIRVKMPAKTTGAAKLVLTVIVEEILAITTGAKAMTSSRGSAPARRGRL